MKNKFLLFIAITLGASQSFSSVEIINALAPLKTEKYGMVILHSKVRGSSAREMLVDYTERVKGIVEGYLVSLYLKPEQIPSADDGQDVVGLTRIIDVVDLITDLIGNDDTSEIERKERIKEVRTLLFKVRDLGGKIGVESSSWDACGVSFPGVIILDEKEKEVISIIPKNTEC